MWKWVNNWGYVIWSGPRCRCDINKKLNKVTEKMYKEHIYNQGSAQEGIKIQDMLPSPQPNSWMMVAGEKLRQANCCSAEKRQNLYWCEKECLPMAAPRSKGSASLSPWNECQLHSISETIILFFINLECLLWHLRRYFSDGVIVFICVKILVTASFVSIALFVIY